MVIKDKSRLYGDKAIKLIRKEIRRSLKNVNGIKLSIRYKSPNTIWIFITTNENFVVNVDKLSDDAVFNMWSKTYHPPHRTMKDIRKWLKEYISRFKREYQVNTRYPEQVDEDFILNKKYKKIIKKILQIINKYHYYRVTDWIDFLIDTNFYYYIILRRR